MDADSFLIRRMKKGDDMAIEDFVRKYYPLILKYCIMHMEDRGYAEDAVQEVFARFFRTLNRYRHYGKALNYLYVIASNVCRDHYRKQIEIPMEELPELQISHDKISELRMDVRMAFEKLPPELKETAILFFFQDVKQKEIARIMGIGVPLVKYRVRRVKDLLSEYLGKEISS